MTWLRRTLLEIEQMRQAGLAARPKWVEFHVAYQRKSPAVGRVDVADDGPTPPAPQIQKLSGV